MQLPIARTVNGDKPVRGNQEQCNGTYKVAIADTRNGNQRFVLNQYDKAVNPTNIMGASKRLCEMVIQSMDMIAKKEKQSFLHFSELIMRMMNLEKIQQHPFHVMGKEQSLWQFASEMYLEAMVLLFLFQQTDWKG